MFRLQLPPCLLFGTYMAFVHPFFRKSKDEWDKEVEEEIVRRVKRRIEVKYGIYCILSLLLWILVIVGIVLLIVRDSANDEKKRLAARWWDPRLWETFVNY
jgi:hypothetical protein